MSGVRHSDDADGFAADYVYVATLQRHVSLRALWHRDQARIQRWSGSETRLTYSASGDEAAMVASRFSAGGGLTKW
jgi:hypothetical protein